MGVSQLQIFAARLILFVSEKFFLENRGILDVLRKTVITNEVKVSTPHGDFILQVFGKVTDATVRQIVKSTVRHRTEGDATLSGEDSDVLGSNFLILGYTTHTVMYECNVFDFLEIATEYKQIN